MTAEAEIGKIYRGKVVTIKEFGAFVEFLPGKDGLVHISELANFRVKQTEDIVKIGDEIWVKCLGVDEKGRVRLSRRAAMEERDQDVAAKERADYEAKHGPQPDGGNGPGEHGERREHRGPSSGGGGAGGGGGSGEQRGGGDRPSGDRPPPRYEPQFSDEPEHREPPPPRDLE